MGKEKIRPIYSEIQGYFSQISDKTGIIFETEATLWNQYNNAVDELNQVTEKNYNKFKITQTNEEWNRSWRTCVRADVFKSTAAGLISRLYGEYFNDETNPLSGNPSTIINQTQQQNQSIEVQFLLEFQDDINKKIQETEDPKEKSFLEKIKGGLSSVKNYSQLLALAMKVGTELGLTIEQIMKLFQK